MLLCLCTGTAQDSRVVLPLARGEVGIYPGGGIIDGHGDEGGMEKPLARPDLAWLGGRANWARRI
jgi:hypothetical protein